MHVGPMQPEYIASDQPSMSSSALDKRSCHFLSKSLGTFGRASGFHWLARYGLN
jgi:hypothetical protein